MLHGYPINVLGRIKDVPEVCSIFCATANPVEAIVAETELGRGILGVVDGELEAPGLVEETTRALSAPELAAESGPELVTGSVPGLAGGSGPDQASQEHDELPAPSHAVAAR